MQNVRWNFIVQLCGLRQAYPKGAVSRHRAGGGGGYYGGGGGADGGASGGGSGYAEPSATNVSSQNGVNALNGSVPICCGYSNGMCGTR
ncbi:MAG: hypothetical protein WCC84_13505 [Candidatus Cybelea sp.]